ncbi:MAG TPA: mechanosensitive ion channel family protein [Vicinamibacterales bacterium]|jgi:small-conductance mechanosensitive channel/CRP-like cAMP-binding protein
MEHYPGHLIVGVVAIAATLAIIGLTVNQLVQRKLRLSAFLFAGYVLFNLVVWLTPDLPGADGDLKALERLVFAAASINLVVYLLINPLRSNRVPDAFPSILQDAIVIGLLVLIATFVFEDKLLTTSAVGAVVVGFALQDTLGNAFAGLGIQSEKPFRVGHWIRVGDFEGRVTEVTWRATKLRTKSGNFVVVPNNIIAKEAITNYSEPATPTRLQVEVGASYLSTPFDVKAGILEALAQVPRVLKDPPGDALLHSFDGSAITYHARFWTTDYEFDEAIKDEVRTAIFYAFARRGIEIPWPIEVGYSREWPEPDAATKQTERERVLGNVDLFSRLSGEQRRAIALASSIRTYGDGETIVRQSAPGDSMFIVCSGAARVLLEPDRREVAVIERGGYFGEMSLLTGDPRSASVVARGDTSVLEIDAEQFRALGAADPKAVEAIGLAAVGRRAELNQIRDAAQNVAAIDPPVTFLSRMKRFLRLE